MKIVHTYINNMYIDRNDESKECFAHKWGLVSLAKTGHEITLICGGPMNSTEKQVYFWNGIKVIELPTLFGVNNTTRLLKNFIQELRTIDADIFHTHHYCSFLPEITVVVGRIRKIPVFITYHTSFHGKSGFLGILERGYSLFMQLFFPLYKKHFFISNYIRDSWHFVLIPKKKKEVRFNLFEVPPSLVVDRKKNSILFLGRITYLKGVDILLRSFAEVRTVIPSATLTLVGVEEGNFGNRMRKLAKTLDLEENITFTGNLSGKKKWQQLFSHEVLVVPSRGEGFGNVVIEGMLCGLPVITSNRGALPEAGGGHALIFNIKEPQELTEMILRIFQNESFKEEIANKAKKYALRYTIPIDTKLIKEYTSARSN